MVKLFNCQMVMVKPLQLPIAHSPYARQFKAFLF